MMDCDRTSSPPGLALIQRLRGKPFSFRTHQLLVLILTFTAYTLYHASRKPNSVVKGALDPFTDSHNPTPHRDGPPPSYATYGSGSTSENSARRIPAEMPRVSLPFNGLVAHIHSLVNTTRQYHRITASEEDTANSNSTRPPVDTPYSTEFGSATSNSSSNTPSIRPGWAPFNGRHGKVLLGEIDLAFLFSYGLGMFLSGHTADRSSLRHFLAAGMASSGFFVALYGAGYFFNLHSLPFFFLVQMAAGVLQSTGWPTVVAIMANWYGKNGRGMVMGIWNAHTSVGNIVGALLASSLLPYGWGWAFLVPGLTMVLGGLVMLLFLAPHPETVGMSAPSERRFTEYSGDAQTAMAAELLPGEEEDVEEECASGLRSEVGDGDSNDATVAVHVDSHIGGETETGLGGSAGSTQLPGSEDANAPLLLSNSDSAGNSGGADRSNENEAAAGRNDYSVGVVTVKRVSPTASEDGGDGHSHEMHAISFIEACAIPGVLAFASCLFFAKLVFYTFLEWLPFYIKQTEIDSQHLSSAVAGYTSTVLDLGGIVGGIVAGYLSDRFGTQATVSASFMLVAVPALALYRTVGAFTLPLNIALLAVVGFFINGPYALITCAVSADLGQHPSLHGNARALATVTAIIDGTGSLGAAFGPFLTGIVSEIGERVGGSSDAGWTAVFGMLMVAALLSALCLCRLVVGEMRSIRGYEEVGEGSGDA